jgi:transcription antitermination factor NusG
MNIVERSSGYWVVDNNGVIDGPFDTIQNAQKYIDKEEKTISLNVNNINNAYTIVEKKNIERLEESDQRRSNS